MRTRNLILLVWVVTQLAYSGYTQPKTPFTKITDNIYVLMRIKS